MGSQACKWTRRPLDNLECCSLGAIYLILFETESLSGLEPTKLVKLTSQLALESTCLCFSSTLVINTLPYTDTFHMSSWGSLHQLNYLPRL